METNVDKNSREVDVVGIIKKILKNWKTIFVFVLLFAVLGVASVLLRTKEYKTEVVLAPETSDSELSSMMDSFGNLIGQSFETGSSDAIHPELYPNIISSTSFLIDLFDIPIVLEGSHDTIMYYDYLRSAYKPDLLSYPRIWISKLMQPFKEEERNDKTLNPFYLTKEQANMCDLLRKNIQCVVDQRTNLITISVTDVDKVVAATIADSVTVKLQEYIIDYRTEKARQDLQYIEEMYIQARNEYLEVQAEYAKLADANLNVVKAKHKTSLENLANEMNLKLNLYSSISQQLQIARQRLQERTPAFVVIEPATVSLEATGLSSIVRLFLFCFVGFLFGSIWSLYISDVIKRKKG